MDERIAERAGWPAQDPEGRAVRFTTREARPRPDEYLPVLDGPSLRLEPMREEHVDALCAVGLDPGIWRLMPAAVRSRNEMARWVQAALAARAARTAIPFVTVLKAGAGGGTVVGSTRFLNIDTHHRRVEIGATWIGAPWQRTRVNTEAKYLMLRHAFEALACIRVEFKTDSLNEGSRRALARIGAVAEGVHRNHVITEEGRIRHSAWFSITAEEWPGVRRRLEGFLSR